jgi:hypothetical protein
MACIDSLTLLLNPEAMATVSDVFQLRTVGLSRRIIVDKVVIAQDSLQRFINAISPGAYASITKVDFKVLDRFMIKPLGVYGSKHEIVKLLRSIGAVDDDTQVPFHVCYYP